MRRECARVLELIRDPRAVPELQQTMEREIDRCAISPTGLERQTLQPLRAAVQAYAAIDRCQAVTWFLTHSNWREGPKAQLAGLCLADLASNGPICRPSEVTTTRCIDSWNRWWSEYRERNCHSGYQR